MKYGDKLITIMKAIWTESIADKIIKKTHIKKTEVAV
jgi:hypothetical protein